MPSQRCPFDLCRMSGLIVLVVLLAMFALDAPIAAWMARGKHPLLDAVVGFINPIGAGVTLLAACLALVVCGRECRSSRLEGASWLGALSFVGAGLFEFAVKHLVSRFRPDAGASSLSFLGPAFLPDVDSFPSGHATSVFAVATAFASYYPGLGPFLYAVATVVAAGRVYLARHYVSDIVAGAAIGTLIALLLLHHPRVRSRWERLSPAGPPAR